jgi:hypothetical protein
MPTEEEMIKKYNWEVVDKYGKVLEKFRTKCSALDFQSKLPGYYEAKLVSIRTKRKKEVFADSLEKSA